MNTFDVLKGPHLTEKSLMIKEEGNHFFLFMVLEQLEMHGDL